MKPDFIWFFLSFKGRINRREFWLGYFAMFVIVILMARFSQELGLSLLRPKSGMWSGSGLGLALNLSRLTLILILVWPLLAIETKRLHDLNLSAWWLLLFPIASEATKFIGLDGMNIPFWTNLIVLGLIPGSQGSNRFDVQSAARASAS